MTPQLRFAARPSVRTGPPHRGRQGTRLRARHTGRCGHRPLRAVYRWPFRRGGCPHPPETFNAYAIGRTCVGAGFYAVERSGTSTLGVVPLPKMTIPASRPKAVTPPFAPGRLWDSAPAGAGMRIPTGASRPRNDNTRTTRMLGRRCVGGDAYIAPYAVALPRHISPSVTAFGRDTSLTEGGRTRGNGFPRALRALGMTEQG